MDKCKADATHDCWGLIKCQELEKQIDLIREGARQSHSEIYGRLTKLENRDSARDEQYKNIMDKIEAAEGLINSISNKIDELRLIPGKKYEKYVYLVCSSIITGIIGYIIGMLAR